MTIFHMDTNRIRHSVIYPSAKTILSAASSERFDISITESTGYRDNWNKRFNATLEGQPSSPKLRVVDPVFNVERVVSIPPEMISKDIHSKAAEVASEIHKGFLRKTLIAAGFKDAD